MTNTKAEWSVIFAEMEANLDRFEKQIADQSLWKNEGFATCAEWLASFGYSEWGRDVSEPAMRAMVVYQLIDEEVPVEWSDDRASIPCLVWGIGPDKAKSLALEKSDGVPARRADALRISKQERERDRKVTAAVAVAEELGEDHVGLAARLGYEYREWTSRDGQTHRYLSQIRT